MERSETDTKKTVRTFAIASFLNDLGSDIIYPIWPLFVTQILKANMAALGFLDGLGEALVSLSQAASGYLSDRWKRRKAFIWIGYLCGGVSRIGYSASTVWQHLIPFRALDRVGKIRSAPRDALIADACTDADRGKNFGLLRAMDNLGAVCGILISIAFINLLGYRVLFALAAVPSLAAAVLISAAAKEGTAGRCRAFQGIALKDIDKNLKLYLFLNAVFALGAFTYSFLLIFAHKSGFRTSFVPVLYLIYTAAAFLFSVPFGRLSDRIGRKPVLIMAYMFWAGVCLGVVSGRSPAMTILTFVLYGIHKAALDPVQRTLVAELAPDELRASFLGGFQMIIGLCAFPASLAAGFLWEKFGASAPFFFSLGLTAVSILLMFSVKEKKRAETRAP